MADQIQLRRDAAANWTSVNPVLADGEIGLEKDTEQFKIGDGETTWSALPYGGLQGPPGADGADGADGAQGPPGADGADGLQGPPGADGAQGPPGADGADGAQGPPGVTGITVSPTAPVAPEVGDVWISY